MQMHVRSYQQQLHSLQLCRGASDWEDYVRRLNKQGEWETVYSPTFMVRSDDFDVKTKDTVWWTKATKYPITATITIQGLLRPATLMQYLRLNVIFPGGQKHLASGLYIVTKQVDSINGNGYTTQLTLTRINGDTPSIGSGSSGNASRATASKPSNKVTDWNKPSPLLLS